MDPFLDLCVRCYDAGGPPRAPRVPVERSALDVQVDRVTAQLPLAWPSSPGAILALVSWTAGSYWLEGADTAVAVVVMWLFMVTRRTTDVTLDAHALTIDRRRMLWEDLEDAWVAGSEIGWRLRDGRASQVRVRFSDADRDMLSNLIRAHVHRPRSPRDHTAEAAVRALRSSAPGRETITA